MSQSHLQAKVEQNIDLARRSMTIREVTPKRQPTAEPQTESSSESDESESASESESESEPEVTPVPRRADSDRRPPVRQSERRNSIESRKAREEQRPRSVDYKTATGKPAVTRPKSAAPAVRVLQNSREPRAQQEHQARTCDSEAQANNSRRPRSSTAPPMRTDPKEPPKARSREGSPTMETRHQEAPKRPNALSFLDPDSPEVTEEHIRRVLAQSSGEWSPQSASSSSSSNDSVSRRSIAETDVTTPEQSINGDAQHPAQNGEDSQSDEPQSQEARYGTPEMARGPAKHPHLAPRNLQPRISAPGQGHAKHLPRAEKLPMSGYELLAAKLSATEGTHTRSRRRSTSRMVPVEPGEASIKPIYRRFEALNHRLLLHLQDELSELEEQLHRLDTADTQTRRLANCILPASRRAEFMAGGELQWHKTDILGKIGFKLGQYNHVLSSFKDTQNLPSASLADVETYRTYLATKNPIAEIETRFLDPTDDLVCLAPHSRSPSQSSTSSISPTTSEDMLTPMPLKTTFGFSPSPSTTAATSRKPSFDDYPRPRTGDSASVISSTSSDEQSTRGAGPAGQAAALCALAIIGPILAFPVVTDFVGRMAVVLVVSLAVAALRRRMIDTGVWEGGEVVIKEGEGDIGVVVGVYGGVMAVIAMLF
ncbi:hypothetical protein OQA88_7491 [Cercophora sp. LCS_1]